MGLKIWAASLWTASLWATSLCAAAIAVTALASASAEPAQKKRVVAKQSNGQVVAVRPRARVTVQQRSFLDPGTEVLPGEYKYNDYALPPGYNPTSVIDNKAGHHRSPLPGPFDLPGQNNPYPWGW